MHFADVSVNYQLLSTVCGDHPEVRPFDMKWNSVTRLIEGRHLLHVIETNLQAIGGPTIFFMKFTGWWPHKKLTLVLNERVETLAHKSCAVHNLVVI